jgi:hypothetical protein
MAGFPFSTAPLSRCMGLWGDGQMLYLHTLFQLWRFENSLGPGETYQGYDRLYLPRVGWTTGDLDIHDIGVDARGRPVFVNTLFGCLAAVSEQHSFVPLWKPPFISKLAVWATPAFPAAPRIVDALGLTALSPGCGVRGLPGQYQPLVPRWHQRPQALRRRGL